MPELRETGAKHHRAADWRKAPAIFGRLVAAAGDAASGMLAFLLLTAARSMEVRGADWSEIDLDAALWVVPASRMKGKAAHRVPLSDAAMAILRRRAADGGTDGLIFAGAKRGVVIADGTVASRLQAG